MSSFEFYFIILIFFMKEKTLKNMVGWKIREAYSFPSFKDSYNRVLF